MLSKKHIYLSLFISGIAIAGIIGNVYYGRIYRTNVLNDGYLYIPTGVEYDSVKSLVRPFLRRVAPFDWVAKKKNYPALVKAGRYKLTRGMNNNDLVNMLRSGNQEPVKVTFNNRHSLEELAGRIAGQIEPDSLDLLRAFTDKDFLEENGFTPGTALCMYIPNTYEMYWNTAADDFRHRMLKEYRKFWNDERVAKAKKLNLTPLQVCILASIVQKESARADEYKTIAGLYLNRLKAGWPLQADPTVLYAHRLKEGKDPEIKRVLNKHLEIDSPYNTYLHTGLPPGPISMPDITAIDAVLDPAYHRYYYMCAAVDKPGQHVFAETLAQHNVNRKKYQRWIRKMGY